MTYDVNHWPERCPRGHPLGPGKASMSWDMNLKHHWLLCGACGRRSRILLGAEGTTWETLTDTGWLTDVKAAPPPPTDG